jgi:hypothetical protein
MAGMDEMDKNFLVSFELEESIKVVGATKTANRG